MTDPKYARLTSSLLARKGEAKPAAKVIDFNVTGMFHRPVEIDSGITATHPTAAPSTARPAAGTYSDGGSAWDEPAPHPPHLSPESLPDPDVLMRQLVRHNNFQPLDSLGTPAEAHDENSKPGKENIRVGMDSKYKMRAKRRALTVRLDPERYRRFKVLAQVGGRTNQEILMDALNEYLDHMATDLDHKTVKTSSLDKNQAGNTQLLAIAAELGVIRSEVEKLVANMNKEGIWGEPPHQEF